MVAREREREREKSKRLRDNEDNVVSSRHRRLGGIRVRNFFPIQSLRVLDSTIEFFPFLEFFFIFYVFLQMLTKRLDR